MLRYIQTRHRNIAGRNLYVMYVSYINEQSTGNKRPEILCIGAPLPNIWYDGECSKLR